MENLKKKTFYVHSKLPFVFWVLDSCSVQLFLRRPSDFSSLWRSNFLSLCLSLSGSYHIVSCLCITRAWMTHCYQQPLNAFARKAQTRFPTLAAVAWIRPSVGGACRRFMGSLNQPRVSWSWQEVNWEVLISPTSCLPSPAGGRDSDKLWQAGKTAYSSRERREINKSSRRPQLFRFFGFFFFRSGGLTVITRCCLFCAALMIFPHSVQSDALFRNGRVMAKLKPNTVFAEWKI